MNVSRSNLALLLVALLAFGAGGVTLAQDTEQATIALRDALEGSFEALPLSDGWLLKPRDADTGYQAIEIRGEELAIDGVGVSRDEVRARLGSAATAVIEFADLDASGRTELLAAARTAAAAPDDAAVADEQAADTAAPEDEGEPEEVGADERRRARRERREVNRTDAQVVVGSSVTVEADEVTRDVLVIGGSLTVEGVVKGDAVAIGGSVDIDGEVTGDVAAIGASVGLESNALVGGDVVAVGGSVDRDSEAVVEGMVQEVPFFPALKIGGWSGSGVKTWHGPDIDVDVRPVRTAFGFAWELFGVAVLALLAALTLLVVRRPVERVGEQATLEPWKSGLVGLLCQILFFPLLIVLIVVLVISIVGIPFLLLLPFALLALALVGLMGYTAVALRLGRWSEDRFGWSFSSPFLALLVGIALLEVWSLVGELLGMGPGPVKFFAAMFAIFGAVLCYAAWTVGFGAAVLSRFGTTPSWGDGGAGQEAAWTPPPAGDAGFSSPAAEETYSPGLEAQDLSDWTEPDPESEPGSDPEGSGGERE